jgi:hypothetical protein
MTDKYFSSQRIAVRHYFSIGSPKTMLEVSKISGIERANICRHVATLQKWGALFLVKKGFCPISKHKAGFYTTDLEEYWRAEK